jgi:cytochrome c
MRILSVLCATAALLGFAGNANAADVAHGRTVFARCAACHDLNTGKTVLGPSLKGVIGRKAGSVAGFTYSPAMKARDVDWTAGNLDLFIAAPTRFVPGTRMPFAGLPDAKDRADLIAYLEQAAH